MALQNLAHERSVAQVKRTVAPVGFGFNYRYTADGKTEVLVPVQVDLVD
jgi:hypothetical protein